MLYLLVQLDQERYALDASCVVEVLPLLSLNQIPHAPRGVAGLFNYRGRPVPAVDLSELTLNRPAGERLSTRIILVNYSDGRGRQHLLGLIAERATELIRRERKDFVSPDVNTGFAPYLGPVVFDERGMIQLLNEQRLLSEPIKDALFSERMEQT